MHCYKRGLSFYIFAGYFLVYLASEFLDFAPQTNDILADH